MNAYPLPRIDNLLESFRTSNWFTTLDLASGYWQVTVHPDDKEKTAFITPFGLYEFNVIPFGLCNAPATSDVHGTRPPHLGWTRTSGTLSKCPCPTNVQTNQMSADMSHQNFWNVRDVRDVLSRTLI